MEVNQSIISPNNIINNIILITIIIYKDCFRLQYNDYVICSISSRPQ